MGLTQVELAQKVGVHRETLAFWEREKTKPNGAQIILLAEALGVQDMNVLIEV